MKQFREFEKKEKRIGRAFMRMEAEARQREKKLQEARRQARRAKEAGSAVFALLPILAFGAFLLLFMASIQGQAMNFFNF